MKLRIMVLIVVALICSNYAFALEGRSHDEHKGSMAEQHESKEKSDVVSVNNKNCPVSGENVEDMGGGVKHEYKGKIYNLCCAACVNVFEKDPEKYSEIAEESIEDEHKGSHHAH